MEWAPNRVWCWDATHFTRAKRAAFAIVDVVSRKWIATVVTAEESSTQVQLLFAEALDAEGLVPGPDPGRDHPLLLAMSDNGGPMISHATREFFAALAIAQRLGRPGTPADQAWIESLFGHVKADWPHLEQLTDPAVLTLELDRVRDGLKAAIAKVFQGASWQRCRVHYARNLLATVPRASTEMVAAAFRTVFAQLTPAEVDQRYDEVTDQLEARFPKAAAPMRAVKQDALAFTPFPFDHWRKVWSNNPLERLNKEIKRRTNVVGIFPSDLSALRLIGAVLADQHDEWIITRRYLSEASMAALTTTRQTELVQSSELTPAT